MAAPGRPPPLEGVLSSDALLCEGQNIVPFPHRSERRERGWGAGRKGLKAAWRGGKSWGEAAFPGGNGIFPSGFAASPPGNAPFPRRDGERRFETPTRIRRGGKSVILFAARGVHDVRRATRPWIGAHGAPYAGGQAASISSSGCTVTRTSSSCLPPPRMTPRMGLTSEKSRPQATVTCSVSAIRLLVGSRSTQPRSGQ